MMKYLIIIAKFFFFINNAFSEEYRMEMFFTNELETIQFPNNNSYLHVNSKGVWKDSYGDYGNMKCYGRILQNEKSGANLDVFCEALDQDKLKFWIRLKRESDQSDAGIGSTTYLYGEDKYEKFLNKKCIYASKVFGLNAIVNQKCKMN